MQNKINQSISADNSNFYVTFSRGRMLPIPLCSQYANYPWSWPLPETKIVQKKNEDQIIQITRYVELKMITNIQSIIGKVQKLRSFNREQNLITGVDKKGLCPRIITWGKKTFYITIISHRNKIETYLSKSKKYSFKSRQLLFD